MGGLVEAEPAPTDEQGLRIVLSSDPDASESNGSIDTLHEHIFRPRFYAPLAGPGQPTLAKWVGDVVAGKIEQVGPDRASRARVACAGIDTASARESSCARCCNSPRPRATTRSNSRGLWG